MPLTEFLSISRGKMDLRPPFSNDPSCRPDADFLELVWENGQIMTQGQSNKSRKASNSNNVQTLAPKPEEDRNANGLKMAKFSMVDSISDDFSLPVTSCEMELDHDVDMVPWLNYPIEDTLHNEYTSDFLRELSGVTWNDLSTENHHLASREKKSSFPGNRRLSAIDSSSSLKHGITSEIPSTTERYRRDGHGEVPQFSLPIEHNMPTSGSLGVTKNNNGSSQQIISQDSTQNTSSLCGFTSLRLQKLDAGQPSTSSSFKNFPTISRHAALAIANHLTAQTASRSENDDKKHALSSNTPADPMLVNSSSGSYQKEMIRHKQSVLAPANGNSDPLPEKPAEEVLSSNQANCKEVVAKTDALHNPANCTTVTKAGMVRERNNEPVVAASSVCSGNSVGRASNEHTRDLKRKSHESGESESRSEEVEEESVGARKAPARTGSKRTRAAEVHNLSERRRRDRINEKMRALQELIPNCNKVDKASMLDEAIEYLKTLQLQVQMLSMGSGFYMQPMMLPPGMQPFRAAHIPHFSPMGFGMGMGMGFGFNMLDMNSGMKMLPFQAPHYPIPNASPAFHGIPGSSLQAFGHPGQGLPMSMQQSPVLPASAVPALNIPVDPNVLAISGTTNVAPLAPSGSSKDVSQQVVHNNNLGSSTNQASIQSRNEGNGHPPCYNQAHAVNASEAPVPSSGTESMPS